MADYFHRPRNNEHHCPACGSQRALALPIPSADQSVLSDGRVFRRRLKKVGCLDCGLIRHSEPLTPQEVAAIYSQNYALPAQASLADEVRGEAYARVVIDALAGLPEHARMLDVGCGSGATARCLARMLSAQEVRGVDPALPNDMLGTSGKVTLAKGFLNEQIGPGWYGFDAVLSINTIEHIADPVAFLAELGTRLRVGARAVVICPTASPANSEILFFDHLWTFSPAAFAAFAFAAGYRVVKALTLGGALSCFQCFVLDLEKNNRTVQGQTTNPVDAARYLREWENLDEFWCAQLGTSTERLQIFGAGQMAAVIRAYTPRTWARAERLIVDNPADAWNLGRVEQYSPMKHEQGYRTIVAVNPLVKEAVARRIRGDGGDPLIMPDTIQF